MKYQVAIAAAAAGASAAHINHQRFHARDAAPNAQYEGVDWNTVAYSFSSGQCFDADGCPGSKTQAAATQAQTQAATQATGAAQEVKAAATGLASAVAAPASAVKSAVSKATSAAGSMATGASSDSSSSGGSFSVDSLLSKVQGDAKCLPAVANAMLAVGDVTDSNPYAMEVINNSDEDMVWACWGSAASWVNSKAPMLLHPVSKNGGSASLAFAPTTDPYAQGPGCAPVFASSTKIVNGQFSNTWVEATFKPDTDAYANGGTIDVSREVNGNGSPISITTSSGCKSDMNTCVFKCINGQNSCTDAGTYQLTNCSGTGANTGDMNGGCQVGSQGKKVTVTVG